VSGWVICRQDNIDDEKNMYKHIMISTDGSKLSRKAIKHGIALAKSIKAKVTAVTVSAPFESQAFELMTDTSEQYQNRTAELAAKHLRVVKDMATAAGVTCNVVHVEHHQPYAGIIIAATKAHCDLIVMASHGRRGYAAVLLGSETVKVLTHSKIPVLVYR
jgi:nucleotide-binding universal stress UspA family protein